MLHPQSVPTLNHTELIEKQFAIHDNLAARFLERWGKAAKIADSLRFYSNFSCSFRYTHLILKSATNKIPCLYLLDLRNNRICLKTANIYQNWKISTKYYLQKIDAQKFSRISFCQPTMNTSRGSYHPTPSLHNHFLESENLFAHKTWNLTT